MKDELRPSIAEKELLTIAYNRFYDLYDEVMTDNFWENKNFYRFAKIKEVFSIYAEIMNYPPLKSVIDYLKKSRPPMEAEIASEFFAFIRNILIHFPFFQTWDDVFINKNIVNWYREGQTIDKFLTKYQGHQPVKYRFWEPEKKRMTYLSINFPQGYSSGIKIFLKDILVEKDGVKFSLVLMKGILDTQVEHS